MNTNNEIVKSLATYYKIRDLILSGEILPGSRLVLNELQQKLNVGRGPVREALMRLDRSGLVNNIPFKGVVVVSPPSYAEMECLYLLRVTLESAMAKHILKHVTPEELIVLEQRLQEDSDVATHIYNFTADRLFHTTLMDLSRMPHLRATWEHLLDRMEVFLCQHVYHVRDTQLINNQHMAIVEAIRKHDEKQLCALLKKNILLGLKFIQKEMHRTAKY